MKDECEIKKVVLNVDGKEINLTLPQVEKLRDLLNSLVKKENFYVPSPYEPYPWNYPWATYSSNTGELRAQI